MTDPYFDAPDGAVLTFPNGVVYERHGSTWEPQNEACSGLTASWCPNHGDCLCPDREKALDDPGCPLHAWSSPHAAAPPPETPQP